MRLLVVDDDAMSRKILTRSLQKRGYDIVQASDGAEALAVMEEDDIDVVIADWMMPGMDGIELCRCIRLNKESSYVYVIMLTSKGERKDLLAGFEAGVDEYIQKPPDLDELDARIKVGIRIVNLERKLKGLFDQLRRDYEIAQNVFSNVARVDQVENKNIKCSLSPMDIVGGDVFFTATGPSGSQYALLGDFTGHGLSAAIGAIPVSDIFYAMAEKGPSIENIVTETNRKLKGILPIGLFLCACFIKLDYTRGTLTAWNGGLPDALIVGSKGGIKKRLASMHLPLGVVDKTDTSVEIVELAQGDFIFVYSDGVTEALNKDGEMFGQERLEEHFANIKDPDSLFDEIRGSVSAFCSGKAQDDDITMAEIRYDSEGVRPFDRKTVSKPEEV